MMTTNELDRVDVGFSAPTNAIQFEIKGLDVSQTMPNPLRIYIALTGIVGAAWLGYLLSGAEWGGATSLGEAGLFLLLILAAGSFALPVAPKVKADVSTAALFGAAIVLEPGLAALVSALGVAAYTYLLRFWGDRLRLPWYKYPFNAGATALYVGLASILFHRMSAEGELLIVAVVPAAVIMYMANTALVTGAASLQMGMNPLRFWWMGTRENGLAELSLLAFGFLGAVVYKESSWIIVALAIPVAVIYFAFSRLARQMGQLEETEQELNEAKDHLEHRVELRTSELSRATEDLVLSRGRIVSAQEELRKAVAQQLHGPVQNRLLVATHWLRNAQEVMTDDVAQGVGLVTKAADLIDDINQVELRSIMRRLHPTLIRVSLQASLEALADQFRDSLEIEVRVNSDGKGPEDLWKTALPEQLRLAMYRIAEEALTNVVKHASATKVRLLLDHPTVDEVKVVIRDDGQGFLVGTTVPGFGILSMQDYCSAAGGTLVLESIPGQGTTIAASFALPTMVATVELTNNHDRPTNGNGRRGSSNGNGKSHRSLSDAGPDKMSHVKEALATSLLIVDDQPDFCELVTELVKPYSDFHVVGESHDGLAALDMVEEVQPDIVLLDMEMPGLHGLQTAEEIRSRFPGVGIVLMSAYHQHIEGNLQAEASEFIPKVEFSVTRLRRACELARVQGNEAALS